jgi:hypothetical protein
VQAPWKDLGGPSRSLAISATVLLVASGLAGVEAAVMLILGPARDIVIRPFIIAGYLEGCAIFFSVLGIGLSMICLILYRPYLLIREKIFFYRARKAAQVSDRHTYFETVPQMAAHDPDEDGTPD